MTSAASKCVLLACLLVMGHLIAPIGRALGATLWLQRSEVAPGDTLAVMALSREPLSDLYLEFSSRTQPLFPVTPQGGQLAYRAYVGIGLRDALGDHPLIFRALARDGRRLHESKTLRISPRDFPEETIQVPADKERLLTSKELAREVAILSRLLEDHSPRQAWAGAFLLPVRGRVTSPFGFRRVYNHGATAWQHRGVDLSGMPGDPILAPNGGRIVLSTPFKAHGNTLVIDHGQGIFSVLTHLQERAVMEGEAVSRGDLVGYIGSTGIATGPHLHWGFSVGAVRVDPLPWAQSAMDQPWGGGNTP